MDIMFDINFIKVSRRLFSLTNEGLGYCKSEGNLI